MRAGGAGGRVVVGGLRGRGRRQRRRLARLRQSPGREAVGQADGHGLGGEGQAHAGQRAHVAVRVALSLAEEATEDLLEGVAEIPAGRKNFLKRSS